MKKFLIACLLVLVVLVGAILVVPSLIDWNSYKSQIVERVSEATGRRVEVDGEISLTLLPSPALTVRDARLANAPESAEPDMARLKQLDIKVALGPLLSGHIQVESITLVEPVLVMEVQSDGRFNWDFAHAPNARAQDLQDDGLAASVSFDQVTVEGGTILYRDARTGQSETLEKVEARIVAGSFAGPFQVQGDFTLRGMPLRGEVFISRLVEGAAVQVRAALSIVETDGTLRFAGIVTTAADGTTRVQGDLRAEGGDLANVLAPTGLAAPGNPALAQAFSLRTGVEAGKNGAVFNNLEAQLGDTRVTGNATIDSGEPTGVTLALALNRLDLDAWIARLSGNALAQGQTAGGTGSTAGVTPGNTSASGPSLAGFALPQGIKGKLDLSVDGVTYNGGVVRQGRVEARLVNGAITIDRFSALLPGGSDLVAAGTITPVESHPALDLRLEANADNLRGLLEWLRVDISAVPQERLRRASVSAQVRGDDRKLEIAGIDLRVDSSHMTGALAYVNRERPGFGLRMALDRLNLDAYLQQPGQQSDPANGGKTVAGNGSAGTSSPANGSGNTPTSSPKAVPTATVRPKSPAERLVGEIDANLDVSVGQLVLNGQAIQGLRLDATLASGGLTLRKVGVDEVVGVKGAVEGQISSLFPLKGVNLTFQASADTLAALARAGFTPASASALAKLGPVKAQTRVVGDAVKLVVEAALTASNGTLEAGGSLNGLDSRVPTVDLKMRTIHPDLAVLGDLFGSSLPGGPVDLYAELAATPASASLSNIQGSLAGTTLRGRVEADLKQNPTRITATLDAGAIDLDKLAPGSKTKAAAQPRPGQQPRTTGAASPAALPGALDFAWLRSTDIALTVNAQSLAKSGYLLETPRLRATARNGVLTVDELAGLFSGGQLTATAKLTAEADTAPALEGNVTLGKAELAKLAGGLMGIGAGVLDASGRFETVGSTAEAWTRALSGSAQIAARDGLVRGVDLVALRDRLTALRRPQELLTTLATGLQGGETRFASLDGNFVIENGVARTDDLLLTSDVGEARGVGQVNMPANTVNMTFQIAVKSEPVLPALTIRLTGPLDQPTRSFEVRELQEYLARRATESLLEQVVPGATGGGTLPIPQVGRGEELLRGLFNGLGR